MSAPIISKGGSVTPDAGPQSHHSPPSLLNIVRAETFGHGSVLDVAAVISTSHATSDHVLDIGAGCHADEMGAIIEATKSPDAKETRTGAALKALVL